MAPTVCLSELPIARSTVAPYSRRRQRVHNGAVVKQQRLELRQLEMNVAPAGGVPLTPPESPLWDPECPNDFPLNIAARVPADAKENWKVFLARREGLLNIVIRTMALVRRNRILQEKVNALRAETRDFLRSVLNNPENKCRQQRLEASDSKEAVVTSSTEMVVSRPSLPPTPDSTSCCSNDVTSTCSSSEWESDGSVSSSEES